MDVTEEFYKRGWLEHMVICSLAAGKVEITEELSTNPKILTMQLNGVELDPLHFIKKLEDCFEESVKQEADKIVEEIKYTAMESIEETLDELNDTIKKMIDDKLGKYKEEEDVY